MNISMFRSQTPFNSKTTAAFHTAKSPQEDLPTKKNLDRNSPPHTPVAVEYLLHSSQPCNQKPPNSARIRTFTLSLTIQTISLYTTNNKLTQTSRPNPKRESATASSSQLNFPKQKQAINQSIRSPEIPTSGNSHHTSTSASSPL